MPFWSREPVHHPADGESPTGTLKQALDPEPLALPESLRDLAWSSASLEEIHAFLAEHYLSDAEGRFRVVHSLDAVRWLLDPEGRPSDWDVVLRDEHGLVGLITAAPLTLVADGTALAAARIDLLCVRPDRRGLGLAPVLIREITRRVVKTGRIHALFTGLAPVPGRVAEVRVWQRPLVPQRLVELGYLSEEGAREGWRLPEGAMPPGLRPMVAADAGAVSEALKNDGARFSLWTSLSPAEVWRWFGPRPGVVDTFVRTDVAGTVTDLMSFFQFEVARQRDRWARRFRVAQLSWQIATTLPPGSLLRAALSLAARQGVHLFEASEAGGLRPVLERLRFMPGPGALGYHLYNWRMAPLRPEQVGFTPPG